jgi:hypothetical protein
MGKFANRSCAIKTLVLGILGAGMLHVSWHKWANLVWDYGRELYVPWRITCGDVLYKDIASLFGPFPPYFNAFLFKMFGVSIMTLVLFNLLLVAGITFLVYRFFSCTLGQWAAFFAAVAFLCLFAFRQNDVDQGIFAYICPYSYSVTYAVFFSWCALHVFAAYCRSGNKILWAAIGALLSLTALCRFEISACLASALVLGLVFKGILGKWPAKTLVNSSALLLAGFVIPVAIAFWYFSTQLPLSQVAPSILGFNDQWREILKIVYYQDITGLRHPWQNFLVMLAVAGCYGFMVVAFELLCRGMDRFERNRQGYGAFFIALALASMAGAAYGILYFPSHILKGLPVLAIFMTGFYTRLLGRQQQEEGKITHLLPLGVMSLWALLMLIKIVLNVEVEGVGFVYAMPATMLLIVMLTEIVPGYFERAHRRGELVRIATACLAILIFVAQIKTTVLAYQGRRFPIKTGPDLVMCNFSLGPEYREIDEFLKNTDNIMGRDIGFVAFPQGAMLNFLTKRASPLPHIIFRDVELIKYGEKAILHSFAEHKPEYIVMTNEGIFPANYPKVKGKQALAIKAWIFGHYHPIWPPHPAAGGVITVLKANPQPS